MEQTTRKDPIIKRVFLSPGQPRLRAGWRLLIQTTLMLALGLPVGLGMVMVAFIFKIQFDDLLLNEIGEFLMFTGSIFLTTWLLDKRPITSLGLQFDGSSVRDILAGLGISSVMMGGIYLGMSLLGWLEFKSFAWQTESINNVILNTVLYLVIFILGGWNEELLSRGYHLQTIASGTNLFWGVVFSSLIFGLLHYGNPNATWVSTGGIFLAGFFLAFGYVRSKQLWLSIGLHIGWNFFEGVVFGFPVSGLTIYSPTHILVTGPDLWTGGKFGPEAGLIVLPALILGAALIYVYTESRISS